jgi:hypothetical protein
MMNIIAQFIAWLNSGMNAVSALLSGLMRSAPTWLSLTVVSILLGIIMLVLFKYTSPQTALGRVRDRIKANLLAMKLFKDSVPAVLRAQLRVFTASAMLLVYSLLPVLVMILPFSLVLGQLSVWYEAQPLDIGAETVIEMQLSDAPMPEVALLPTDAVRIVVGPVRVPSEQQVYWKIEAMQPGVHTLQFKAGQELSEKQITIGTDRNPVSIKRPALHVGDMILYPAEKPFTKDSAVQSIAIDYPERTDPITGSGNWVISLFVISMLGAFAIKPFLNMKI